MIEHVYRRAAAARNVDAVLVATDDARIADAVTKFGGDVRMTRSSHAPAPTGSPRWPKASIAISSSTCRATSLSSSPPPSTRPSSPFAHDAQLVMTSLCRRFRSDDEARDPHIVKVVTECARICAVFLTRAHPLMSAPPPASNDAGAPFKHIGLYVQRREFLLKIASLEPTPLERAEALEQLRTLEHGFSIQDDRDHPRLDRRRHTRGSRARAPLSDGRCSRVAQPSLRRPRRFACFGGQGVPISLW